MLAFMILVPNPRALGDVTDGPPDSSQCKFNVPVSGEQRMPSIPSGVDSAPYLAELVASSCRTSARLCDRSGDSDRGGPSIRTRFGSALREGAIFSMRR